MLRMIMKLDDHIVVCGLSGFSKALIEQLLRRELAVVLVTDDEESNLVTCLLAKHLRVNKTVALLSKGAYIPISQSGAMLFYQLMSRRYEHASTVITSNKGFENGARYSVTR